MCDRRRGVGEGGVLDEGELGLGLCLVGDTWSVRGSRHTPDGSAHPLMQLNVMSSRMVALLAPTPQDRALAGDQLTQIRAHGGSGTWAERALSTAIETGVTYTF